MNFYVDANANKVLPNFHAASCLMNVHES